MPVPMSSRIGTLDARNRDPNYELGRVKKCNNEVLDTKATILRFHRVSSPSSGSESWSSLQNGCCINLLYAFISLTMVIIGILKNGDPMLTLVFQGV